MNPQPNASPPPGINLGDILYVIFRHKWKIMAISTVGIVAAGALYSFSPKIYQSEAKLLVKYVVENKSPRPMGASDSKISDPDSRGETVINTELEIMTSLDLLQQVADTIGPERILGKDGGTNRFAAAQVIRRSLLAEVSKKSSVIAVAFQSSDPTIVQPLLNQLIETYFNKHAEIHRALGVFDDFLQKQTDELRSRLAQTEQALRAAKTNAGVISLADSKKFSSDQISKIEQTILDTEAELAERQAAMVELAKMLGLSPMTATNMVAATNAAAATGAVAAASSAAATPDLAAVPSAKIAEYKRVCSRLEDLYRKQQELLAIYTPEYSLVKSGENQIAASEKRKQQLEDENPGLLAVKSAETKPVMAESNSGPKLDFIAARARVTALEAKLRVLKGQQELVQKRAAALGDSEGAITELERKKDLDEAQYRYFQQNLEQIRMDDQLGTIKNANISKVQTPSPPVLAPSKLLKMVAMVLFGSIAGAFALAFALEFYLDQSLKRPRDIETKIGLPLFISIPKLALNGKGKPHLLGLGKDRRLLAAGTVQSPAGKAPSGKAESEKGASGNPAGDPPHSALRTPQSAASLAAWDPRHALRPFAEALRDRLITYFEVHGLTHKPKLVAVTSCGEGAGVSTVAAGLAASLSETGDGNVLLVNMNLQNGAAQQFFKGDLACGLDEALETEKRDGALVQDNLYVVSEGGSNSDRLPSVLPKRFKNLVPRLKASDYDYIIFDMPPMSQISLTPRLARFMDMVLMVVESEKTDREVVRQASSMLADSKANAAVVFNKTRTYVPKHLLQEL